MNSIRCKFNIIFLFFVYWFVLGKEEATCVVVHNFSPNFNVCANGQVIRMPIQYVTVPPMHDLETNTQSKDVIYSPLLNLTARIFLPLDVTKQQGKKLPVIVYYHGGLFSMFSYANPMFNSLTRGMSADSNAIVISVDYRLAPEQHLPVPFEDSWTAIQWIASHVSGNGPEEWLNSYADFDKFFLMGDSAGATISVNMALRFGERKLNGINLLGMILQMPYFINLANLTKDDEFDQRLYKLVYPTAYGTNNFWLNPGDDPKLATVGSPNVFVLLGEKDVYLGVQKPFFDKLVHSGWKGKAESREIKGAKHMFYLGRENATEAKVWTREMSRYISLWSAAS